MVEKDIIKLFEVGKRLLDSDDYSHIVEEQEKELAETWFALCDSPTTDPKIAELQGKLRTLKAELGRPRSWVQRYREYSKQRQESIPDLDDYETG